MDERTPEAWYFALPPITRTMVTTIFCVTLSTEVLGIINPDMLLLDWSLVVEKLQVWRLLTDFTYFGKFSFGWIISMYFLVTYSSELEKDEAFRNSRGSYLYFVLFQCITLGLLSLALYFPYGSGFLGPSLSFSIIYYWSRTFQWTPVQLWLWTVQGYQLPFALLALDVMLGASIRQDLMGLFTGHLYHFLRDHLPREYNMDPLGKTPKFLDDFIAFASSLSFRISVQ